MEDDAFDLQAFLGNNGMHFAEPGAQGHRAVCFASGSNRVPDIRGFVSVGIPPGLAADQLVNAAGEFREGVAELLKIAGTGMPVFLDSGAFGEFRKGVPISDEQWSHRLALYEHLAKHLGAQLFVVAPDKIGDQAETLARLQRYSMEMRYIQEHGAQVLLPMQPGAMDLEEFQLAAQEVLGFRVTPAFPMRSGTTPETVVAFVAACRPAKIHLLGMGAANRDTQELLEALWDVHPELQISQDANLLAARAGRTGSKPRPLTAACDRLLEEGEEDAFGWFRYASWGIHEDYTEAIASPQVWLSKAGLEAVAQNRDLNPDERKAWMKDPEGFLQSPWGEGTRWQDPFLQQVLDQAWTRYVEDVLAPRRRADGIHEAFADHPAAWQFPSAASRINLEEAC